MDFLFHRYGGSPFSLLDRYIEGGRFSEFVYESWSIHNEEELYRIWLHKVDGKSYSEFRDSLEPPEPVDRKLVASAIGESMRILDGFSLQEG